MNTSFLYQAFGILEQEYIRVCYEDKSIFLKSKLLAINLCVHNVKVEMSSVLDSTSDVYARSPSVLNKSSCMLKYNALNVGIAAVYETNVSISFGVNGPIRTVSRIRYFPCLKQVRQFSPYQSGYGQGDTEELSGTTLWKSEPERA